MSVTVLSPMNLRNNNVSAAAACEVRIIPTIKAIRDKPLETMGPATEMSKRSCLFDILVLRREKLPNVPVCVWLAFPLAVPLCLHLKRGNENRREKFDIFSSGHDSLHNI